MHTYKVSYEPLKSHVKSPFLAKITSKIATSGFTECTVDRYRFSTKKTYSTPPPNLWNMTHFFEHIAGNYILLLTDDTMKQK